MSMFRNKKMVNKKFGTNVIITSQFTAFVTSSTIGSLTVGGGAYYVGFRATMGGVSKTITHLGRYKNPGDVGTHTVGLFDDGYVLYSGGSVSINMNSAPDADGYVYVALASPIIVSSSANFRVLSLENSADRYGDYVGTSVTTTAIATIINACYNDFSGSTGEVGSTGQTYVPLSMKYQ